MSCGFKANSIPTASEKYWLYTLILFDPAIKKKKAIKLITLNARGIPGFIVIYDYNWYSLKVHACVCTCPQKCACTQIEHSCFQHLVFVNEDYYWRILSVVSTADHCVVSLLLMYNY